MTRRTDAWDIPARTDHLSPVTGVVSEPEGQVPPQ